MKKILFSSLILFCIIFAYSCDSKFSKSNHLNTLKIDNHLFFEIYKITSGGVLASDTYSYYLTDSVTFRKYVGTIYYDDEHLYFKPLDSNHVLIYKAKRKNMNEVIEEKVYVLSELQKEKKFD